MSRLHCTLTWQLSEIGSESGRKIQLDDFALTYVKVGLNTSLIYVFRAYYFCTNQSKNALKMKAQYGGYLIQTDKLKQRTDRALHTFNIV